MGHEGKAMINGSIRIHRKEKRNVMARRWLNFPEPTATEATRSSLFALLPRHPLSQHLIDSYLRSWHPFTLSKSLHSISARSLFATPATSSFSSN
jgi:hypothetical protein